MTDDQQKTGAEKRKEKLAINSVEELIGVFLKESVGLYVKQKSLEHNDPEISKSDVQKWAKEDFHSLLKGLAANATGPDKDRIQSAAKAIDANLDVYIGKLDKSLEKQRDKYLAKAGNMSPNGLALDEALVKTAPNSSFARAGEAMLSGKSNDGFNLKASVCKAISAMYGIIGNKEKEQQFKSYAAIAVVQKIRESFEGASISSPGQAPLSAAKQPGKDNSMVR
jgi:hypothetical protein